MLDAHNRAFAFFGGVPRKVIYDNLKTVVDAVFAGKERQFNRRFLALASHYLFEPVACTPASGWEKGQIENQVGNVREWLFTPTPRFADFAALNAWLATRCQELGARRHPTQDATIAEIFALEQPMLQPVSMPFDAYIELPPNLRRMARLQHVPRNGRPQSLQRSGRMGRQSGLGPHQRAQHTGRGSRRACRPA